MPAPEKVAALAAADDAWRRFCRAVVDGVNVSAAEAQLRAAWTRYERAAVTA